VLGVQENGADMGVGDQAFDAIIIGGGPAGASCAVWLARLGFSPLLLEAGAQVGGLCRLNPFDDEWNATLPGAAGPQVADNLALSLQQAGVPVRLSCPVAQVRFSDGGFSVATLSALAADTPLRARYIVLATGVRARTLPGQGDGSAPSRGTQGILTGPGEHVMAQDFRGRRVAVLGGGDNAFENALYAMQHGAASVHIYARTIRAQQQFVRRVPADRVVLGEYAVDAPSRTVNGQVFDLIMVFYGWEPSVRFADTLNLQRTASGFIATDPATAQASHEGVYAIGEVAQRQHPCVVTALADGVAAAKAIQARIEAGP
jgi:thioredoxin reductase